MKWRCVLLLLVLLGSLCKKTYAANIFIEVNDSSHVKHYPKENAVDKFFNNVIEQFKLYPKEKKQYKAKPAQNEISNAEQKYNTASLIFFVSLITGLFPLALVAAAIAHQVKLTVEENSVLYDKAKLLEIGGVILGGIGLLLYFLLFAIIIAFSNF